MTGRAAWGLLLLVCACGGPETAEVPEQPAKPSPKQRESTPNPGVEKASVVERSLLGVARSEAAARATREAQFAVVGPDWTQFLSAWQPTLPETAFTWSPPHRVELRLRPAVVEQLLTEFATQPLQVDAPAGWQKPLLDAFGAERGYLVCQQRQVLLGVPCTLAPPELERDAVVQLMSSMVLEPAWLDGVPVNAEGEAVAPLRIRTWERTERGLQALANLPLRVEWVVPAHAAAPRVVRSDASGVIELPLAADWEQVGVRFANAAMLGPLAALWPGQVVEMKTRPLDRERLAVVTLEHTRGRPAPAEVLSRALLADLGASQRRQPVSLPQPLSSRVRALAAQELDAALRARITEATQGRVDYLLLVSSDSEFASQMGMGRTWYQARAHVRLVELWSGRTLQTFEIAHTESGIGDARAEEAARLGLAGKIVERLSRTDGTPQGSAALEP